MGKRRKKRMNEKEKKFGSVLNRMCEESKNNELTYFRKKIELLEERDKKTNRLLVELGDNVYVFQPASHSDEIDKIIKDVILNLLEKWRHSKHKKTVLSAFSKYGTSWYCSCMECNKEDGIVYD